MFFFKIYNLLKKVLILLIFVGTNNFLSGNTGTGDFKKGLRAIRKEKFILARSHFINQLKNFPGHAPSAYKLAQLYSNPGMDFFNLDSAGFYFQKSLENYE